jgi:hypothetical protein
MRSLIAAALLLAFVLLTFVPAQAQLTEDEMVEKYMGKREKTQVKKTGWISGSYALDRINRNNNYNSFASYASNHFPSTSISWLGQANIIGLDFGLMLKKNFAVSFGGEYWMKFGEDQSGTFSYTPPNQAASVVDGITSEITVYGVSTNLQYYFYNAPTGGSPLTKLAARVGFGAGWYEAKWDLWQNYQDLNLATSTPTGDNATFKDNTIGLNFNVGIDYPLNKWNLGVGLDFGYQYLNFDEIAWYNSADEEVVVTYAGTADSRVELDLSGFRGKVEVKKFFSW